MQTEQSDAPSQDRASLDREEICKLEMFYVFPWKSIIVPTGGIIIPPTHFHLNCRAASSAFRSARCVYVCANGLKKLDVSSVGSWNGAKRHKKLLSFPPNSPNIEFNDVNFPFSPVSFHTFSHLTHILYVYSTAGALMWKI